MYCIYQIDDKLNESVTDVLENENDFRDTVIKKLKLFNPIHVESLSEDDVRMSKCFKEGYYLLLNKKEIKLIQKIQKNKTWLYLQFI